MVGVEFLVVHDLGQAKVRDLDVPVETVSADEKDIAGLQVIVNDGRFDLVEINESRHNLHDDACRLFLWNSFVLLEKKVEIVDIAEVEDSAEAVAADLEHVLEPDDPGVVERHVDVVLPEGVLHVVALFVVRPVRVELVQLAGHVLVLLQVEALVHLGEAAIADEHEEQVRVVEDGEVVPLGLILYLDPLQLPDVNVPLSLSLSRASRTRPQFRRPPSCSGFVADEESLPRSRNLVPRWIRLYLDLQGWRRTFYR